MLAMQYSFTLPSDYDMGKIRERTREKGPQMDGFAGLVFKAYLLAGGRQGRENLYAPFYLWEANDGMNRFLGGPGFAALTRDFGWPQVRLWSVWQAEFRPSFVEATAATRELVTIPSFSSLSDLRSAEEERLRAEAKGGALGAVVGFEPLTWTVVRFRLYRDNPVALERPGVQAYEIGYLSTSSREAPVRPREESRVPLREPQKGLAGGERR